MNNNIINTTIRKSGAGNSNTSSSLSSKVKTLLIFIMILGNLIITYDSVISTAKGATTRNIPDSYVLILTNNSDNSLAVSLGLDYKIHYNVFVNGVNTSEEFMAINFSRYDVIIIDGYLPENLTELYYLKGNINGTYEKTGVIFFGGNYTKQAITLFSDLLPIQFVIYKDFLNQSLGDFFKDQTGSSYNPLQGYLNDIYNKTLPYEIRSNEVQVSVSDAQSALPVEKQSMYVTRIAWQSCPLLYDRILTYAPKANASTLVQVPNTKEPLMVEWNYSGDASIRIIYLSPGTGKYYEYSKGKYELNEWNKPFRLWPYFNYLMYLMVYDVKGLSPDQIETYAEWPWSPIPHQHEAAIWMTFVAGLWIFNFVLFFSLGKKKRELTIQPEAIKKEEGDDQSTDENTGTSGEKPEKEAGDGKSIEENNDQNTEQNTTD
ncbi:MAG: hypothetical protein ACTSU2_01800 [Promethearchaeota archaeon]